MMSSVTRSIGLVVVGVLALLGPRTAHAGAPSDQLRSRMDRVVEIMSSPDLRSPARAPEREKVIREVARETFDFLETARLSLGDYWNARTPAERTEFVRLFTALLEHTWVQRVGLVDGRAVRYLGDTTDGDEATVRTTVVTKNRSQIDVAYRMRRAGDTWRIYDVLVEGESLVASYHAQFSHIIRSSSYRGLIEKMQAKVRQLSSPAAG